MRPFLHLEKFSFEKLTLSISKYQSSGLIHVFPCIQKLATKFRVSLNFLRNVTIKILPKVVKNWDFVWLKLKSHCILRSKTISVLIFIIGHAEIWLLFLHIEPFKNEILKFFRKVLFYFFGDHGPLCQSQTSNKNQTDEQGREIQNSIDIVRYCRHKPNVHSGTSTLEV